MNRVKTFYMCALVLAALGCQVAWAAQSQLVKDTGVLILAFADRHTGDRFSGEWEAVLPLFKKYNARATFVLCGKFDGKNTKSLQKIAANGHTFGTNGRSNIYSLPHEIKVNGRRNFLDYHVAKQCKEAKDVGVSFQTFFYPGLGRTPETDELLLSRFDRILLDNGIRTFNMPTNQVKPLVTDDRMFFPTKDLPNRRILTGVKLGQALRTDIDDLLACVQRAAKNKEVVMFWSHGIKAELKDQHMKTEWLERILAEAKKCGVRVLGLGDLPPVVIPAEKKCYAATLPKGVKTLEVGGDAQLKTLEDALAQVAQIRKKDKKTPLAVRVAPGDYRPSTPLEITSAHASPACAPLFIYAADFTQKPRINGGWPWEVTNRTTVVKITDGGNCSLAGLDLTGCGDGVRLEKAVRVAIRGCDIRNLGGDGIVIDMKNARDRTDILLENNHIHDVGLTDATGAGIRLLSNVTGVRITHNFIHDASGSGIHGMGHACDISYNDIRRVNTKGEAAGAIYLPWRTWTDDTLIRYNWISDTGLNGACGIHVNGGGNKLKIVGNHIQKCRAEAVRIRESKGIVVSNNVFVSNGTRPVTTNTMQYTLCPGVIGVQTVNNIFHYPDAASGLYLQVSGVIVRYNVFDRNLVWPGVKEPLRVSVQRATESWLGWRKQGADRKSLFAEPMFRSAHWGNYRLHDESAAFNRGFQKLPYDDMGLQETLVRPHLPQSL